MGIFNKKITAPKAYSSDIQAGAAGTSQIGSFLTYRVGTNEERAQSIPTVNRAADLMASMIACLDMQQYTLQWDPADEDYVEIYLPGESWMSQPDPRVTRNFIMANTFRDLFYNGRAFWAITSRYSNGFPATFTWLPSANMSSLDMAGPQWFGPSEHLLFNGQELDSTNVVQFLSPIPGLLFQGARAVSIALRLDSAAERFASTEIAAGYLQQRGGEPMSAEDLGELAGAWANARRQNSIGALNEFVEWKEFSSDPSKLQLVEAREFSSLELARTANVPPYLVGIGTTGMTYNNAQQARQDLYLFGAKPYIDCIQETLSMNTILPRGRHVKFDLESYLNDSNIMPEIPVEQPVPNAPAPSPAPNQQQVSE
jgi:hypothetical protein